MLNRCTRDVDKGLYVYKWKKDPNFLLHNVGELEWY